jgi:hypothetical protein
MNILGCGGSGTTIDYSGKRNLELQGILPSNIAVIVRDERPYVSDESYENTFVGVSRSFVGVPYSSHTTSGRAFAEDFAGVVQRSLEAEGSRVAVLTSDAKESEPVLISRVREPGRVALVFKINDWRTDTYFSTSFIYDVELSVIDGRGIVAAKAKEVGEKEVVDTEGGSEPTVLAAMEEVLEDLMNAYRVQGALGAL